MGFRVLRNLRQRFESAEVERDRIALRTTVQSAVNSTSVSINIGAVLDHRLTKGDIANRSKFDATGLGVGTYKGWAICNGRNGTPDLHEKFIRYSTEESGAISGSDAHAHGDSFSVDGHALAVSEIPNHDHDSGSLRMVARDTTLNVTGTPTGASLSRDTGGNNYTTSTPTDGMAAGTVTGDTGKTGGGGSHSHGLSGAVSSASNIPAHYTMVPLMRVA